MLSTTSYSSFTFQKLCSAVEVRLGEWATNHCGAGILPINAIQTAPVSTGQIDLAPDRQQAAVTVAARVAVLQYKLGTTGAPRS